MATKSDRILKAADNNHVFDRLMLESPKDFEQAFKPTKWSIRLFMNFLKTLNKNDQVRLVFHTTDVLSRCFNDKNTLDFLKAISLKCEALIEGTYSFNGYCKPKIKITGGKFSEIELISTLANLKRNQVISCKWQDLASLICDHFDISYKKTTVLAKLYDKE